MCVEKNKLGYAPISHHFSWRDLIARPVMGALELGAWTSWTSLDSQHVAFSESLLGAIFEIDPNQSMSELRSTPQLSAQLRPQAPIPYTSDLCPQFLFQVLEISIQFLPPDQAS